MFAALRRLKPDQSTAGPNTAPAPGGCSTQFRDLFFGDTPLDQWGRTATGEPWTWFAAAREALMREDRRAAIAALERVVATPGLESRHTLVAWNALRGLGVNPSPERAKHLLGVVIDMPVDTRYDVLACYEDNTARYINHTGGIVVIDTPVPQISAAIADVLAAARPVVARIGPHDGARPGPPALPNAQLSFLTPSGLHFGRGDAEVLMRDPMGGPVIGTAVKLLQAVIALSQSGEKAQ